MKERQLILIQQNQTYYFWQLIDYLIDHCNYRLVRISEKQNEVWLENPKNKVARIIRLVRADLDWANRVKRDIEVLEMQSENLRKHLMTRELHIVNLYITEQLPVDDITFLDENKQKGKVFVQSYLIDYANREQKINEVSQVIGEQIHIRSIGEDEIVDVRALQEKILLETALKAKEEKELFGFGKPFFTYLFIAIQVIVFLLMELNGGSTNNETLLKFGAKYNVAILDGEWWRFITPMFVHIGWLHLFMNTLSLYYLGMAVEKMYGKTRFVLIYLFAGFTGTLASFLFSETLSAGASGAIFGCFGALLYMGASRPQIFFRTIGVNVIALVGINLLFGFSVPGIDNAGHIGGLLGGFLMTAIVHFPKRKKWSVQLPALLATIVLTLGSLYAGFGLERTSTVNLQLQDMISQQDYQKASELGKRFTDKGKGDEITYFQYSLAEIYLGNVEDAIPLLEKAIEIQPKLHEAHYNLAILYMSLGEIDKAKTSVETAISLHPDEKYEALLKELE